MSDRLRVADYERVADGYDHRYSFLRYEGVREALTAFLGSDRPRTLEVGCGTGHWLRAIAAHAPFVTGMDLSSAMLAKARSASAGERLVRARADHVPFSDATFDRVFCVNALHHFGDRARFFAEARRILRPGGALLTIGKDPHAERDEWWVYDFFPETVAIDRERFAPVRLLRGELARAGFDWAESFEADRLEAIQPAATALSDGTVHPAFTSQLTVLTQEEFERGVARVRAANEAAGGELQLVTDFRLYAAIGRLS
ncbi:MAG TPA: class I SAM-dependent methyltransferase [Vicinamibacterales bacterium]|nr:class I SAM-dependent methyltransferase [Vicinamibacterales bacterium]